MCRRIGHARGTAVALANMGGIELVAGRRAQAGEAFRAALAVFAEIHDLVNIATCLVGLGGTLDDPDGISHSLGRAEHLLQQTGGPLQPADQRQYDELAARCLGALGEAGFARARAEGRVMSLAEAIGPGASKPAGCRLHWPTRVVVERVQLTGLRGTLERDQAGAFPVQRLFTPPASPSTTTETSPALAASPTDRPAWSSRAEDVASREGEHLFIFCTYVLVSDA